MDVFEKFNEVDKGKVDKYDDTLIKKKNTKSKHSREDFDEFYSKSKTPQKLSTKKKTKNEAQEFEKFYKKKKTSDDDKKTKSPKSKKKNKK